MHKGTQKMWGGVENGCLVHRGCYYIPFRVIDFYSILLGFSDYRAKVHHHLFHLDE